MSSVSRSRSRDPEPGTAINERILKECHNLYTDPCKGLVTIGDEFKLKILQPRKKIVVLLIGNHSAGKSSFINWYIEENVQKTGVAIETQGFTIVTNGRKRESLTGEATLIVYPHFKPLQSIPGVMDFLSTEISPSDQKKFKLVTFVDTPGLVDGDTQYPYDVNRAVLWLGNMADRIFVFFDPIGQALCKRTLSLVESLNKDHAEKMRFYLTKADDAGNESDRQRVMMQIVQELCKRPGLNRTGFDMPTIYIPSLSRETRCVNQIDDVCLEIERTINATVQNTLNSLERDCAQIETLLDDYIRRYEEDKDHNFKKSKNAITYGTFTLFFLVFILLNLLLIFVKSSNLEFLFGSSTTHILMYYLGPVRQILLYIHERDHFILPGITILTISALIYKTRGSLGLKATIGKKQYNKYKEWKMYFSNEVGPNRRQLYRQYLEQSVGDLDL